ncbi:zinc knuckle CX2CX4HX4C containing protein [Tanacetum coccineum]
MDSGDEPFKGSLRASMIKNIEGKMIGKDGKPLRKAVRFSSHDENPMLNSDNPKSLGDVATPIHEVLDDDGQAPKPKESHTSSFASVLLNSQPKQTVKISEMRNMESVDGARVTIPMSAVEEVSSRFKNTLYGFFIGKRLAFRLVENYVKNTWAKFGLKRVMLEDDFFLFQFESKDGMEKVMEGGPWLIRLVPLFLNIWTPNTLLRKDEIKSAPVWIKLHHVPIVAYSEVGLSLITTQIGRPIMLDTYTSSMCLKSWGRKEYARALVEVLAEEELLESLVVAIPKNDGKGHTLATISIEYEWKPPRCGVCKVFDHVEDKCPKVVKSVVVEESTKNDDDGFTEVKKKKHKPKQPKQVEGVRLSKPKPNFYIPNNPIHPSNPPNPTHSIQKQSPPALTFSLTPPSHLTPLTSFSITTNKKPQSIQLPKNNNIPQALSHPPLINQFHTIAEKSTNPNL